MRFSTYRKLREEEEQKQDTGTGVLVEAAPKQAGKRKFTDVMKEREPERYVRMTAERKYRNVSEFADKVNKQIGYNDMQAADAMSYINKHKDNYTLDADDNAVRRKAVYDQEKENILALMQEAHSNTDLDTQHRQQALNALTQSLANINSADKMNEGFSDYMKQFANKEAFDRTREAERKLEEAQTLTPDELRTKISETEKLLEQADSEYEKLQTMRTNDALMSNKTGPIMKALGFYKDSGVTAEDLDNAEYQKTTLENDIQNYKNIIFEKEQSETLDSLSDSAMEALEKYYQIDRYGVARGQSTYNGSVIGDLTDSLTIKPVLKESAAELLDGKDFDSVYEYYKFARDKEIADKSKEFTEKLYNDSNAFGKFGMNAMTVMSTPTRGISAAKEMGKSLFYKNEYAPLNINSENYTMSNYTDTVRNVTSQDIENDKLRFLYQSGMSIADSAVLKPLDVITGGAASLAIMGTNAATSAAKEATLRGASKEQALLTGLAAGGAEAVFEKVSLDHFWDIARNQGKAATRSAFLNVLAQAGIEGSEEVFTDLANAFTDRLINGGLSEWYQNMDAYYKQGMSMSEAQKAATADFRNQLVDSFLSGALSGGVFGTAGAVNTYLTGKRSTMSAEDYQQTAEGIDTDRSSYMSQEDYDTAMGVQRLAQALSQKENVTDYEKGLFEQESSLLANIKWNDSSDNNQQEQIRQIAETMPNETVANAFVADYKEGMPVDTYKRAFHMFYEAGYTEMSFEQALKTSDAFEAVIGKPTLYAIHSLGMNQAAEASKTFTATEQKKLVNTVAKALGITVQYQDIPGANGMYKDGMIYISNSTINPSMVVMSHELTHHLKAAVAEEYAAYENYVIDYFKEYHAGEYDALYNAMAEEYGNNEALIREEIAANAAETFLTDADAVNRFVTQNRSIAGKIADFLNDFIAKLKKLYQGYKAQGKAGKMLAEDIEVYEKARDLWYEAINAEQTNKSLTTATDVQAPVITSETISGTASNKITDESQRTRVQFPVGSDSNDLNSSLSNTQENSNAKFMKKQGIEDEIQQWFDTKSHEQRKKDGGFFEIGRTSEALKSIGLSDFKIYLGKSKVQRFLDDHPEMSLDIAKQIPDMLENPLVVMSSKTHSKTSLVIVGDVVVDGKSVLLPLLVKPEDGKVQNFYTVTSAYGKEKENLEYLLNNSTIYYIEPDKKRTDIWAKALGVQFPSASLKRGSIRSIPKSMRNSNAKFSLKEYDLWDKKNPRVKFHVSDVSEPLISVGIDENREITFDSKKIIKIKADHPEMTDEVIKNVDKIIKEPIAIMNSASVAGRITLVGELEGENGVPVMIALELNPANVKGIEIDEIKICSAYTRNNFVNWVRTQDYLWINPNKNKTDTWLKRTRVQFPVGINQYGLIKSIPQKQQNSNAKFSLKEPMEETKNLIALHNLTSDKLMKTLDLGGFPMPSIAITNMDIGHSNFGDISCVFYKDTINPANKKNKVFGADAWTPTFPRTEYEADLSVARNVQDTVSEYAKKLPESYHDTVCGFVSGLEYSINNWGGYEGIIEQALKNTAMKAAYLVSKGEKVDKIEKIQISELEPQKKESCEMLLKVYGSKADKFDGRESGQTLYEAFGEATKEALIQNAVSRGYTEENARAFANRLNKFQVIGSIRTALKYRENKGIETTTVIDFESMRKDIENRVDMNDYEGWLRDLFEGIEKNSGLWNGKSHYTPSGNMRSFKQTHIPFNVQNIVEAMLKQSDDVRNVAGFNGIKTIRAVVTEDFKSISEIKNAAKTKLKNIDTEEYNALRNKLDERLNKVIRDIADAKPISNNVWTDMDNIGEIIIEACKNPTADNFKNTFNKYSRICTNEQAKEIADIVDTVANMPVNMFEAKPLRVVDFSEVAAVILPKGTSKELIQKITDNGMRIMEYEAGNESERKEVLNSIQGVKFSLKAYTDELGLRFSDKEGSDLVESVFQDDVSESYSATTELVEESARILQDGMAAAGKLKEFNVTRDMAQALAVQYLKKYNATFDKNTLTDNLFNIFAYIQKNKDVNYQDMIRLMQEVCKPVIATSQKIDKEMMKQYNDFRKTVKSYHIRLNKAQRQEVEAVYGKFDAFKAANQNRYGYTDYGYYLSKVWEKLVDASQNALSYSTPVNEQMLALHDYMTSLEKAAVTPAGDIDNSQSAYDMALNIYTDYFSVANKENKRLARDMKRQMNRKLDKYRKEIEKSYQQQVARQREIVELEKQAEIDRLQKTMKQMLDNEFNAMDNEMAIYTSEVLNPEIAALKKKIKAIRQSNTQKIADLKAKNYQSYLNRSLAGKKTAHRNHIKKNMLDLQNRLAKPKEHKYIPRGLVRATIELCEAVNIDTGKSEGLAEHLADMSRLYAKMKDDKDYAVSSEYDPNTQGMIERLQYIFQGRNITTLELEELQEVDELVSQLRFQIVNAGKLIGMEKSKEVYETAVKCMDEIKAAKSYNPASGVSRGLNKYNTMMLNPKRQFRRMSGYKDDSVMNQIYEDLNNGQQKQMQVLMETARIFDPVTKEKHNQQSISKLVGKEKKDWIDIGLNYKNMDPVMVPRAFRVSLAMHIQNKANLDHIIYGGLTIPEPKAYQRGDYATAYATGTTIQFIPADADTPEKRQQAYYAAVYKLKSVVAQMTPYERSMVKCSEQFFHEYTGEKINEVSLQLNGYKKARVDKYFPIRTDPNFRPTEIEGLVRNGTLEHSGMLESRTGARNPILLEDITRVIQRQSENVAKYYGLAIPIRNFNKIYNTTKIGYQDSTKSVIARKWGIEGQKYIENLITDLQTKRGREHTILDTLQGNFAQSVLSNNLSVAAQQIVAYPTAAATLGHNAVIKGIQYIPTKLDMEHIAKYTPLLWYRNQGTGTQEIGDVNKSKNIMSALASKATNVLEQHNMNALAKLTTGAENTVNWTMELLQRIDTKAVGSLWKASEIYVRDTKKLSPEMGEDAFYREVAKVFNECVDDTQANYSTMQRPDILRNPNEGVKMLFLFKTQPLQNFAIMYDAYGNLRAKAEARKNSSHLDEQGKAAVEQAYKKAVNDFANAISSQLAAASLVFVMKLFANAFTHRMDKYRNDEDDISGWKMIEELVNEVASNMAGSVIGGSEVYELMHSAITGDNYYGISVGIIDSLNDFTESLLRFKKEMTAENLKRLYFDSEILTGVPGENIYKIFNGLLLHAEDFKNGEFLSFNAGHETKLSVQYTAMMNALVDGNTERYEERYADALESLLLTKTEKEAKTAIKAGIKAKLKKSYQEADITYNDTIAILEKLDDKEPYFTVKQWENDENKEYNKYSELEAAVLNGHGIDEEIKELTDNGVREENVNAKLTSILREGYIHGDISEERVSQYLKQYKTDYTDDDVYWKLREWDKAPSYAEGEKYSKYDDLLGAVESGSFEIVVKEYVTHGSDAQSIKQQISQKYRPLYQEAYLNGRHKEVNAIKELLNKLKVNGKRLYGQDDYLGWNKQAKKEEKEKNK